MTTVVFLQVVPLRCYRPFFQNPTTQAVLQYTATGVSQWKFMRNNISKMCNNLLSDKSNLLKHFMDIAIRAMCIRLYLMFNSIVVWWTSKYPSLICTNTTEGVFKTTVTIITNFDRRWVEGTFCSSLNMTGWQQGKFKSSWADFYMYLSASELRASERQSDLSHADLCTLPSLLSNAFIVCCATRSSSLCESRILRSYLL